ncbi:helix-hairpin-helix domain-containing protein [Reichenbachiella versicolor]|uniref:helix-hairpin-helix domain-containing protein n=1 Tax=Reichenbachiella versicolor TaxID=1821036 RepID=UPI000D6DED99|nr:helix-hairpin-helix domain-containing protein [Reichenbachiella versicolor]
MFNYLTKWMRSRFGFTKHEIQGMFVLIPLMTIILFIPKGYKMLLKYYYPHDFLEEKAALEAWKKEIILTPIQEPEVVLPKISPQYFNPNTISKSEFIKLGFKEYVADRLIKYRRSGGVFKKKKDLMKIYGINKSLVKSYFKYIIIPDSKKTELRLEYNKTNVENTSNSFLKEDAVVINLNTADTTELQSIVGVGKYWSSRIVKYREALGGFVDKSQIKEMYGIKPDLADRIIDQISLQEIEIKKVDLNTDSVKVLARHPYISYKDANSILRYKKQHGEYQSVDQIKNIISISDSVFSKISPYLEVRK